MEAQETGICGQNTTEEAASQRECSKDMQGSPLEYWYVHACEEAPQRRAKNHQEELGTTPLGAHPGAKVAQVFIK